MKKGCSRNKLARTLYPEKTAETTASRSQIVSLGNHTNAQHLANIAMFTASAINLGIVIAYLLAMLGLGIWLARYIRGEADYFIAGRSLNRWVICGSIMSTNVAAVYLVGPAGRAYEDGIALLLMAWTGNMLAAISAVTFVPRFRMLRITTITELLHRRFHSVVSMTVSGMWLIFYAMFRGVTMFTCTTVLSGSFGIPDWIPHRQLGPVRDGHGQRGSGCHSLLPVQRAAGGCLHRLVAVVFDHLRRLHSAAAWN